MLDDQSKRLGQLYLELCTWRDRHRDGRTIGVEMRAMSNSVGKALIFVWLVLNAALGFGSDVSKLPRKLGSLDLGMSIEAFKKAKRAEPSSCATCAAGEQYSEIPLTALPQTQDYLDTLGFSRPSHKATVNCFFYRGRLYSIRIGEFGVSPKEIAAHLSPVVGPPKDSRSLNGEQEITWLDPKTAFVVSGTKDGFTDVIAADIKIQRMVDKQ